MSRPALLVTVAALVFAAGYWFRSREDRERAASDQATLASLRLTVAELERQTARVDTVYRRQVDTLRVRLQRWDTVRTVVARVDTLLSVSVDTLRLVVAVADSTIAACSTALDTCEDRDRLRLARIAADSAALRALSRELARARVRSRLGCVVGPSAGLDGVTYAAIGCGVRIW